MVQRTIYLSKEDPKVVHIIDQRKLPFHVVIESLRAVEDVAVAIKDMHVRGAGCIGVTAGFGVYLACVEVEAQKLSPAAANAHLARAAERLKGTRPTAANLSWAVKRQLRALLPITDNLARVAEARRVAQEIAEEDVEWCRRIGEHGVGLIEEIAKKKKGEVVNILTHCNAGWLAFVEWFFVVVVVVVVVVIVVVVIVVVVIVVVVF